MPTQVPRVSVKKVTDTCPSTVHYLTGQLGSPPYVVSLGTATSKLWKSSGNRRNPKNGNYETGGDFYVTHELPFHKAGHVDNIVGGSGRAYKYSGPIYSIFPGIAASSPIAQHHSYFPPTSMNSSLMDEAGTTAIAQCAPNNPTANLGVTMLEGAREGLPSLPGIQSWKRRVEVLRNVGSEYLNVQFGWKPLEAEVNATVNTARNHRDMLQNYRHNEGRYVHRRFELPSESTTWEEEIPPASVNVGQVNGSSWYGSGEPATRVLRVEYTRERWFEGCFTYGGLSKTDSFGSALRFGEDADALYGTRLSPDVLWEATPWSWAIDWFSNTGDLIHNITNFGSAGLVMRYGFMMEKTISTYRCDYGDFPFASRTKTGQYVSSPGGSCSAGIQTITKARKTANPFGFGVGWEDLSPTQLAITAAIGITRLL